MKLLINAADFAAKKHKNQRRKNPEKEPYINHPINVCCILSKQAAVNDEELLCAAMLHDTIEDTDTTQEELAGCFNEKIASIVMEVSDDKSLPKNERKRLQVEHASSLSDEAKQLKLADKISNLQSIICEAPEGWSIDRQTEYFRWAKEVVDEMRGVSPDLEGLFDKVYKEGLNMLEGGRQ